MLVLKKQRDRHIGKAPWSPHSHAIWIPHNEGAYVQYHIMKMWEGGHLSLTLLLTYAMHKFPRQMYIQLILERQDLSLDVLQDSIHRQLKTSFVLQCVACGCSWPLHTTPFSNRVMQNSCMAFALRRFYSRYKYFSLSLEVASSSEQPLLQTLKVHHHHHYAFFHYPSGSRCPDHCPSRS